jgi:excisionase family DNA binding protein
MTSIWRKLKMQFFRDELLTYPEAAAYLKLSVGSLRNLVSQRKIPVLHLGRRCRFSIQSLNASIGILNIDQNFGYKYHGEGNQVAPKGIENGNKKGSSDRPVDRISLDQVANRWQNYLTTEKKSKK